MLSLVHSVVFKLSTPSDRRELDRLAAHPDMGSCAQLVYIYSLGSDEPGITYPRGLGSTVYIGETKRETGAGLRFRAHVSRSLTEGLSTNINHSVSVYYHQGRSLHLRVFSVTDGRSTKGAERILLQAHLHVFGAFPIGQGSSGRVNTPCELSRLVAEQGVYHEACAKLLGGTF